jgi:hypothetical protein
MKASKINYQKLNFLLSVIGFIGSIGFYIGVLKEVYSENPSDKIIQELRKENQTLKDRLELEKQQSIH